MPTTTGWLFKKIQESSSSLRSNIQRFKAAHQSVTWLSADANDDVSKEGLEMWNSMLARSEVRNAHTALHENQQLIRTHNKGSRCIDIIAISDNIPNNVIQRAGILLFYSINATDHWPLYIDLDRKLLFDDTKPDLYKQFNTNNIKKCDIYLKNLDWMFEENEYTERWNISETGATNYW